MRRWNYKDANMLAVTVERQCFARCCARRWEDMFTLIHAVLMMKDDVWVPVSSISTALIVIWTGLLTDCFGLEVVRRYFLPLRQLS